MNHLDEMAGARWAAVQIAFFTRPGPLLPPRRSLDLVAARRERPEDRLQAIEDLFFSADHEAISAFGAPDSAARADIQVVDALLGEPLGPPHIIFEVRIPTINNC